MRAIPSALVALCLFAGPAQAAEGRATPLDEAPIRAGLARIAPQMPIERISPSAVPGLAEVSTGSQIYYISLDGSVLIHGSMLRTRDGVDLSEIRRSELRAAAIDALPADARVRYAPSSAAKHRVTVFTAVDCGYCRRFHAGIEGYLAEGIAVDYVMIPLAGPGSEADRTSSRVYCADDRQAAFTAATEGLPFEAPDCRSAYPEGVALAQRLAVGTTPTIVTADGRIVGGFLEPAQLKQRLLAGH